MVCLRIGHAIRYRFACPLELIVGQTGVDLLGAGIVVPEESTPLGFLGDGTEIDQLIVQFAVHAYLHWLSIAAESSIMEAKEAIRDQRRDKAPYMGGFSIGSLAKH